jgi:hypothetical protein
MSAAGLAIAAGCAHGDEAARMPAHGPTAAPAAEPSRPEPASQGLVGRFALFMRRIASEQPDTIEIDPDGRCVFDMDGRTGIVGTCRVSPEGMFTVDVAAVPRTVLFGKYTPFKYSFRVVRNDGSDLFYVRWPRRPAKPHPPETALLGTSYERSNLGEIAQVLSPDHTFRFRGRDFVAEYRVYFDFEMQGHFSYADGILTYRPTVSTALEKVDYLNDFVVSRDETCVWVVDPFLDDLSCGKPAPNLDLPPPPAGFSPGPRP